LTAAGIIHSITRHFVELLDRAFSGHACPAVSRRCIGSMIHVTRTRRPSSTSA
jgi:hypothetical protein